jgi:hypothetical protein
LVDEFGFTHVVRPNRGWLRTAGNLIHAFSVSQYANRCRQTAQYFDISPHSRVTLWWTGFETRHLPLAPAKCIAPNNLQALANQQYRWCRAPLGSTAGRFRVPPGHAFTQLPNVRHESRDPATPAIGSARP